MVVHEYQKLAMRTNDGKCNDRLGNKLAESKVKEEFDLGGIINACLGLSGEVGEVNDMIKKWVFHGHELSEKELRKEVGDVCWYLAMISESFGLELDTIMRDNIKKLKNRYPQGFSEEASINRTE